MGPAGRLVGGLKALNFGEEAIPQRRRLIGGQNRLGRAGERSSASSARRSGVRESMSVRLLRIRSRPLVGLGFGGRLEVRGIEVILSGNPDQSEQGISPCVC